MQKWTMRSIRNPAITVATVDEEHLDKEVVVLLNSINVFGDKVYSYVKLTIRNFLAIGDKIARKEKFMPSEFGTVLAAGKGYPDEELQKEMQENYNMQPITPPAQRALPPIAPRAWGDEGSDDIDGGTITLDTDFKPTV